MTRELHANQGIDPLVFSPAGGVGSDISQGEIFLSLAERQMCPQPRCRLRGREEEEEEEEEEQEEEEEEEEEEGITGVPLTQRCSSRWAGSWKPHLLVSAG